jgi:hypothetical protein
VRAQSLCDGRPIRGIRVGTASLFAPGDPDFLGLVRAAGNAVHARTRPEVVRRELLFREGDPCDPARLAETARVLRALPYIREVIVSPVMASDGGLDVLVDTRDEWSLRASVRVGADNGFPVRQVRVAEENVLGRGLRVQLRYDGQRRRPAYDVDVTSHQFLGRLEAQGVAGRSSVGLVGEERILRPFKSEYDRVAWRESALYRKEPFFLIAPELGWVDVPVLAVSADLGVAARWGTPGQLALLGGAFSAERLLAVDAPMAHEAVDDSAAAAAVAGRYSERRRIRLHLFAGARAVRFRPHFGVDAVHALEDVREGVEAGIVVGKSLFGSAGLQRDWFAAGEFAAGAEFLRALAFLRGKVEGRYLLADRRWDGVLGEGQALVYTNVSRRGVFVLSVSGAGGWNTRTPFQLRLGGPAGIRGYGMNALPVGRRIVLQGEHRYFVGTLLGAADVGTAAFVDVGRGWVGDAVFGEDTGLRASVGGGLRIAAPRGSRRTYRIDIAVPLDHGGGLELQVGVNQQFGVFRGEPADLARSREQVSSSTIFNFPRF